jgi:TRAP-type C4-dicarboxylate transport system permease small subunit
LPGNDFKGEKKMHAIRMAAVVLIIAGALALAYGGFTYTRETHDVKLGPIAFSVKEKKTVNVPVWAGIGAIVAGGLLLAMRGRKA